MEDPLTEKALRRTMGLYRDLEDEIIREISDRVMDGVDRPDWEQQKVAEIPQVRRALDETIREFEQQDNPEQTMAQAVESAYTNGTATADRQLRQAVRGYTPGPVNPGPMLQLGSELAGRQRAMHQAILGNMAGKYRGIVAEASAGVISGTQTRQQAAQRALAKFANKGVDGLRDSAGRMWSMDSYAEMSIRSATNRARAHAHNSRLLEGGHDLVYVSDSPEECPICRPWEGKVLSISGESDDYPALAEATSAGLFHPNCTHSTSIYIEGVTQLPEPDHETSAQAYEERQRQRELERNVRQWKRRAEAAGTPEERAKCEEKIRQWQGELRTHTSNTHRRRLSYREGGQVAPFQQRGPALVGDRLDRETAVSNSQYWAMEQWDTLNPQQQDALRRYTFEGGEDSYKDVNEVLRKPDGRRAREDGSRLYEERIRHLDAAAQQGEMDLDTVCFRGVKSTKLFEGAQPGDRFVDPGFCSTSLSEEVAEGFLGIGGRGTIVEIEVPQGQKGIWASYNHGLEAEFILPRETAFEVARVTDEGRVQLRIVKGE